MANHVINPWLYVSLSLVLKISSIWVVNSSHLKQYVLTDNLQKKIVPQQEEMNFYLAQSNPCGMH